MIIQNGTVEFIKHKSGGIDLSNGFAYEGEEIIGNPIPCQISFIQLNLLAQTNNERYTNAKYTVLLEDAQEIPTERLILRNRKGIEIGKFSAISIDHLEAVCQYKIIC